MTQPLQQPRRRARSRRNAVAGVLVLAACGGCSAVDGGQGSGDQAVQQSENGAGRASASVNPLPLRLGKPFTLGGMRFHSGWRVRHSSVGTDVTGLEVTGRRGKGRVTAQIELRLWSGDELLGIVRCSAGDLAEGQTKTMDCSSTSRPLINYTVITANTL